MGRGRVEEGEGRTYENPMVSISWTMDIKSSNRIAETE